MQTTLAQNDARHPNSQLFGRHRAQSHVSDAAAQSVNSPLVNLVENFPQKMDSNTHTRARRLAGALGSSSIILLLCSSLCREGVSGRDDARVWVLICLSSVWEVEKIETTAEIIIVSQRPLFIRIRKCDETQMHTEWGRHGASAIYSYVYSSLIPAMFSVAFPL